MLATMMLDISTIAKLSQRNKNHSVSATSITILNAGGIDISRKTLQRRIHSLKNKNNNLFDEHI
jgi:hypothetical protein